VYFLADGTVNQQAGAGDTSFSCPILNCFSEDEKEEISSGCQGNSYGITEYPLRQLVRSAICCKEIGNADTIASNDIGSEEKILGR
jgi:hypothetical protein